MKVGVKQFLVSLFVLLVVVARCRKQRRSKYKWSIQFLQPINMSYTLADRTLLRVEVVRTKKAHLPKPPQEKKEVLEGMMVCFELLSLSFNKRDLGCRSVESARDQHLNELPYGLHQIRARLEKVGKRKLLAQEERVYFSATPRIPTVEKMIFQFNNKAGKLLFPCICEG